MLLKILDILECPICNEAARLWKLNGDVTETRITNGKVDCPKDHTWIVKEEILRFDEQNAEEPMLFQDHPRTGFPQRVKEQERFDFLDQMEELVSNIQFENDILYKITGDPILFMKYLPQISSDIIFVYKEEGILRQLQEMAVRKRIYDQIGFIRADDVTGIGKVKQISIFQPNVQGHININLDTDPNGEMIWQGEIVSLAIHSE